jgi:hypothetical protein
MGRTSPNQVPVVEIVLFLPLGVWLAFQRQLPKGQWGSDGESSPIRDD